jgi:hypothetical protein
MRLNISRTAAVLTATLAVAACGTQHGALPGTSKNGPPEPASFVIRAQQVTAQWDGSRAAHAWRTGLVLMDASDLVSIPRNAGFGNSQRQKDAFGAGHFRLAAALPAQPLRGVVRWANGATLRLPLLSAKAAFAELAAQRQCGGPYPCGQLTVTGVQPGAFTVNTSRGPASVPAWRFTVAELGWQASEVAVAQSALVAIPGPGPIPVAGMNTPGVGGLAAVSADGRTLTLTISTGACDTAWGAYSYESARTVVVGSWQRAPTSGGACVLSAAFRTARVTLTRPLGTRVVLDVASGRPLVLGS